MIQRIQTVFLILVVIGMFAYLFLPYWMKADEISGSHVIFTAFFMKQIPGENNESVITYTPYIYGGIGAVFAIIIASIEIFMYKNRLTQIKLGLVNSIIMSLTLFFSAWLAMKGQQHVMPAVSGSFEAGLFAPVFSMIFNSLANRYIKKDEDLVRSIDRIR